MVANPPNTLYAARTPGSASSRKPPLVPVQDAPAPPPARVFSGIKARLAGQILESSLPAPPSPHRPTPAPPARSPTRPQRKHSVQPLAQPQQFDSRGRPIRNVVDQVDDQIEDLGGPGEDDIVFPGEDCDVVGLDVDRRMDLEVLARLQPSVDDRDREVRERTIVCQTDKERLCVSRKKSRKR